MSTKIGQNHKQQKAMSSSCWQATRMPSIVGKATVSFFMLLTLLLFSRMATAATPDDLLAKNQNPLTAPAPNSYQVAQQSGSLDNWHSEAFAAIDRQKRLDRLSRQQKKQAVRSQRKPNSVQKRKAKTRPKSKKAVARIKSKTKPRAKANRKAQSKMVDARSYRDVKIVRAPAKLQSCLQTAGYFKGPITGTLDNNTRQAYLAFRNARKLRHRPNNFYDPVIQKTLFEQCPKVDSATPDIVVASVKTVMPKVEAVPQKAVSTPRTEKSEKQSHKAGQEIDRSQGPLTTASIGAPKKQARLSVVDNSQPYSINKSAKSDMHSETSFANEILAATNSETNSPSSASRAQKLARLDKDSSTGASSSFAITRPVPPTLDGPAPGKSSQIASSSGMRSSPFAKRLSISDLAMAKPVNPNTCAPQKHAPAMAMSVMPAKSSISALSSTQAYPMRTASAYDVDMNDDGPLITGSISPSLAKSSVGSSDGNPILKAAKRRSRLVQMTVPDKACLPQDLYNMLATAHGRKTDVTICRRDCLPAPRYFSQGQKELFTEQYDIHWCGTGCLGIADPLPLAELLKIERDARVHVCMKPQLHLTSVAQKGLDAKGLNAPIRNLFKGLPGGYGNGENIAVLIGNKNYGRHLGAHDAGHINIAAMKALLIEQLGYSPDNVLILKDAKRADMVRLFGRRGDASGELQQRMKSNPDAQLMVYFSGHASSTGLGLNNHLLPVDAVLGREDESAYSLSVLYDNLRELDARTTQLFLEASFNGDRSSVIEAPNIAERRVNVAPIVPVRGLAVFTASTGDQKPLLDPETGIGLFTRYLMSGLAGAADQRPIGNGDRIIDSVELYVHLAGNVRLAARKTLGLRQNPTFSRSDNLFLSQLSRKPRK